MSSVEVGQLVRLLAEATAIRRIVAVDPEPEIVAALQSWQASAHHSLAIAHQAIELQPALDQLSSPCLVYAGASSGAEWHPLGRTTHDVLVLLRTPPTAEPVLNGNSALQLVLPVAPAPAAARLTVMLHQGAPPEKVRQVLDAIAVANRRDTPTQPVEAAVGSLLFILARVRRAKRVLELGTSAGASSIWLASALAATGGRLTSIERDSAKVKLARRNLHAAGVAERVDVKLGEAERILPRLYGPYDMVFLDEAIEDRTDDVTAILPKCLSGALIVSHGALADPHGLTRYNALVRTLPQVRTAGTLAVGAGMGLAIVG